MDAKFKENIQFAQTVLSLTRDSILVLFAVFAALIVYLGGDPSKLTELDWALLLGAAVFVVIAPAIGFYLIVLMSKATEKIMEQHSYTLGRINKVPRGLYLFWYVVIRKLSLREYVNKWAGKRLKFQKKVNRYFIYWLFQKIMLAFLWFNEKLYHSFRYVYATMFLLVGINTFIELFSKYV